MYDMQQETMYSPDIYLKVIHLSGQTTCYPSGRPRIEDMQQEA